MDLNGCYAMLLICYALASANNETIECESW